MVWSRKGLKIQKKSYNDNSRTEKGFYSTDAFVPYGMTKSYYENLTLTFF